MISVIIPYFNAEKSIGKALDSIRMQKGNFDFEIILINDGSTDNSSERVEEYRKRHPEMNIQNLHQNNKGVSAARNLGIRISKGDYIALLDADDEWFPEKTMRQIQILEDQNLPTDMLATEKNQHKMLFPYFPNEMGVAEVSFRKLLFRNEMQPSTVIFKRKILQNTGYFDESQRFAEDVNFWLRTSKKNKIRILGETLVLAGGGKRSFGTSGLSANLSEMRNGFCKNAMDMFHDGRISKLEAHLYQFFYHLKYWVLIIRTKIK